MCARMDHAEGHVCQKWGRSCHQGGKGLCPSSTARRSGPWDLGGLIKRQPGPGAAWGVAAPSVGSAQRAHASAPGHPQVTVAQEAPHCRSLWGRLEHGGGGTHAKQQLKSAVPVATTVLHPVSGWWRCRVGIAAQESTTDKLISLRRGDVPSDELGPRVKCFRVSQRSRPQGTPGTRSRGWQRQGRGPRVPTPLHTLGGRRDARVCRVTVGELSGA